MEALANPKSIIILMCFPSMDKKCKTLWYVFFDVATEGQVICGNYSKTAVDSYSHVSLSACIKSRRCWIFLFFSLLLPRARSTVETIANPKSILILMCPSAPVQKVKMLGHFFERATERQVMCGNISESKVDSCSDVSLPVSKFFNAKAFFRFGYQERCQLWKQ